MSKYNLLIVVTLLSFTNLQAASPKQDSVLSMYKKEQLADLPVVFNLDLIYQQATRKASPEKRPEVKLELIEQKTPTEYEQRFARLLAKIQSIR